MAAGLAEDGAEFRTDISAFVSQEVIDGCVAHSPFELPPGADISYLGFVDPSGGASDAMALTFSHRQLLPQPPLRADRIDYLQQHRP